MSAPAIVNVLLNLVLIPRMGVMGAAFATTISYGFGIVASWTLGQRALALPVPWMELGRVLVATGLMAAVVLLVPAYGGAPELMAKASVGAMVYAVACWILNTAGVRDRGSRVLKTLQARFAP